MAATTRQDRWQRWRQQVCAEHPELQKLQLSPWPTTLAIQVEDAFADTSLLEPERVAKAEQLVLSHYLAKADPQLRSDVEACLGRAVQIQVQDDFEHWKIDASAA